MPLADPLYAGQSPGLTSPYIGGFSITASDTTIFAQPTRAVWVGGAGDLAVAFADGSSAVLSSVPAGTMLEIRAVQVKATDTTATKITGLY